MPAAETAPTGEEGNGLIADLNGYYPTVEQWRTLLAYETRQHLSITEAAIPDSWQASWPRRGTSSQKAPSR